MLTKTLLNAIHGDSAEYLERVRTIVTSYIDGRLVEAYWNSHKRAMISMEHLSDKTGYDLNENFEGYLISTYYQRGFVAEMVVVGRKRFLEIVLE